MKRNLFITFGIIILIILITSICIDISNKKTANSPIKSKISNNKVEIFKLKQNEKCLVIAPHPDDESLGCGGLLIKYAKQCDVVFLTDGRFGIKNANAGDAINIRQNELKQAMSYIGVNSYKQLDIIDTKVKYSLNKLNKLNLNRYDYVFIPNKYESHLDHSSIYKRVKLLLIFSKTKIVLYEVWTPLTKPSHILDLSDIIDMKKELISFYKSQLNNRDYINGIMGLNKYRGMQYKKKYAEAYYIEK